MIETTPGPVRASWLDVLRGVAAPAVLIHHYYQPFIPNASLFRDVFNFGTFGVVLFFCLSGYVIPYSVRKHRDGVGDAVAFVAGRTVRLYPIYWLSVAFAAMLVMPSTRVLLANLTMMQRGLSAPDMIGVYWTLQVELGFYAIVTLGILFGKLDRVGYAVAALAGSTVLSLSFSCLRYFNDIKAPVSLTFGLTIILLSFCYYNYREQARISKNVMRAIFAITAVALAASMMLAYAKDWGYQEHPLRFIVTYGLAVITFVFVAEYGRQLRSKFFEWLGAISFPLYLFHQPVWDLLSGASGRGHESWGLALAATLASFMFAALIHHLLEAPMHTAGRKLVGASRARVSAFRRGLV